MHIHFVVETHVIHCYTTKMGCTTPPDQLEKPKENRRTDWENRPWGRRRKLAVCCYDFPTVGAKGYVFISYLYISKYTYSHIIYLTYTYMTPSHYTVAEVITLAGIEQVSNMSYPPIENITCRHRLVHVLLRATWSLYLTALDALTIQCLCLLQLWIAKTKLKLK